VPPTANQAAPLAAEPAGAVPAAGLSAHTRTTSPATGPPAQERTGPSGAVVGASEVVPWWVVGVLVLGAGLLIFLNWPGEADSTKLWYDPERTGWYVYRSWGDPIMVASIVALLGSLVARWAGPIALGVAAGAVASVLEVSLLILGGGIWLNNTETPWSWLATVGIGLAMAVVLLIALRPGSWRVRPVPVPGAILVVAGSILVATSGLIKEAGGFAFIDVTFLAVLEPLLVLALGWLALAAVEPRAVIWLTAATTTYAAIGTIAALPALDAGYPANFLTALFGYALVVAGVVSRVLRLQSRP
jgi:hypothetical protein